MATGIIIVLVIVVVLLVAGGLAATLLVRRRRLRQRFGPEYDQLASEVGERRALAELSERERRVAQLDIRPLSQERRDAYGRQWMTAQETFVDGPAESAEAAGALVSAVAADRGYPADDEDRLLDDLSVHHADRLDGYRRAREITRQAGRVGTEDLRQALLSYRALFRDLMAPEPGTEQAAGTAEQAAPDRKIPAAEIARNSKARTGAAEPETADAESAASADPAEGEPPARAEDAAGETATSAGSAEGQAPVAEGETTAGAEGVGRGAAAGAGTAVRGTPAGPVEDGETWVDSGRDRRAPAAAAREE